MAKVPQDPKAYDENTQIANRQRNMLFSKNRYTVKGNEYSANHPTALSTNERLGKGENNGQVGNDTDIQKRKTLLNKNIYNKQNKFNY